MKSLIYCDTSLDKVGKINLENNVSEYFPLEMGVKPFGPYNLKVYNNLAVIANSYNNSISIIDMNNNIENSNIKVGSRPVDVGVFKDKAYVVCSDSNSLNIVDIKYREEILTLPLGEYPQSIYIDEDEGIAYTANMLGNSICIVDCNEDKMLSIINNLNNPTKIKLSHDKKNIYVCEGCLFSDTHGYITLISTIDNTIIERIKIGKIPIDLIEEEGFLYVTNLGDGSISVVCIGEGKEILKLKIGGMPRGIEKLDNKLYICDYEYSGVYEIDFKNNSVRKIASGKEPNAIKII